MLRKEELAHLEIGEIAAEKQFQGVNFNFEGFEASVLELQLNQPGREDLRDSVSMLKEHPEDALVIFDEDERPRLIAVFGSEERWSKKGTPGWGVDDEYLGDVPFMKILRIDTEDDEILVQGTSDYHQFEDRYGNGMVADYCLPDEHRYAGTITIVNEGGSLVISAVQGELRNPDVSSIDRVKQSDFQDLLRVMGVFGMGGACAVPDSALRAYDRLQKEKTD